MNQPVPNAKLTASVSILASVKLDAPGAVILTKESVG
jgi:hypothetical protein